LGLQEFSPTRVCTEVVTTQICCIKHSDNLDALISSTSPNGSVKYLRKQLLTSIVQHTVNGLALHLPDQTISQTLEEMSYTDRFLLPYFSFFLSDKMEQFFPKVDTDKIPRLNKRQIKMFEKRMHRFDETKPYQALADKRFKEFGVGVFSAEDEETYTSIKNFAKHS